MLFAIFSIARLSEGCPDGVGGTIVQQPPPGKRIVSKTYSVFPKNGSHHHGIVVLATTSGMCTDRLKSATAIALLGLLPLSD